MTIRKLKAKQRGPYCPYCPPKTTRATHRGYGHSLACEKHLPELREQDARDSRPDYSYAQFYAGY